MKSIWPVVGFVVSVIALFAAMFLSAPKRGEVIVINCGISEISPDFTPKMREECRKLRKEQK